MNHEGHESPSDRFGCMIAKTFKLRHDLESSFLDFTSLAAR